MMHLKPTLLILGSLFLLFTFNCRSPNESIPLRSPDGKTPVVTGMYITNSAGEILATWGSVDENVFYDPYAYLLVPYPNPTGGRITIPFAVPKTSVIDIWVVPAILAGQEAPNVVKSQTASFLAPGGLAIRELIRGRVSEAGHYEWSWDGLDSNGNEAPGGFYRIYIRAGDYLFWNDILMVRSILDVPPELRSLPMFDNFK